MKRGRCSISLFTKNDLVILLAPIIPDRFIFVLLKLLRHIYYYWRLEERKDIEININKIFDSKSKLPPEIIKNYYNNIDNHNLERLILTTNFDRINYFFKNIVEIDGLNHLTQLYEKYKKLLLFAPHFGPYSLVFLRRGIPKEYHVCILIKPPKYNLEYKRLLRNLSKLENTTIIIPQKRTIERVIDELNMGHIVILFSDRANLIDIGKNIKVNIFGNEVYTQKGLAVIMKKTEVPVLGMYCVRLNVRMPFNYKITFTNQIFEKDDYNKNIQEIMQILYNKLERLIKEYPGFWERWKKFEKWKVQNYF